MNIGVKFKHSIYLLSLLSLNLPLMSYATCDGAIFRNNTPNKVIVFFANNPNETYTDANHKDTENGSGNVWILPIENALDCTLKNGPCTLNPGDAIQIDYTTHLGLSAGLVGVLSYPNSGVESGELDLTYSNYSEAGNYKCPKIRFIGTSGTALSYTSDSGSITVQ